MPFGSGKGSVTFNPANTATLDINGIDTTVNGLVQTNFAPNNQVVNNGSGMHVLTVGAADTSSTFSGTLADNNNAGTGILALRKTGSGTLTLGGANTFSGPANVNAGTLYVAAPGSLNASGTVGVAVGATLAGNGSVGLVNVASGGILDFSQNPAYTALTAAGVTFQGNASVNVANLNTYSPLVVTGNDTLTTGGSATR